MLKETLIVRNLQFSVIPRLLYLRRWLCFEPIPALPPVFHDLFARDKLVAGSCAVVPIVFWGVAVCPPLRTYQVVCIILSVPSILNSYLTCNGLEALNR